MKRIIFLIAVLISFGAKAQLSADSVLTKVFVETEYMLLDTFTKGSSGDIDTVMYSEIMRKADLPFDTIPNLIFPNNDTVYKLVDNYRLDWLRSVKVVRYRMIRKLVYEKTEKPINRQMYDLAKKRHQQDYDIDLFWNHPKVKAVVETGLVIVNDSIE